MSKESLVRQAEHDVLVAARAWADAKPWKSRTLTPEEEKLKYALFMLERAQRVSGHLKLP